MVNSVIISSMALMSEIMLMFEILTWSPLTTAVKCGREHQTKLADCHFRSFILQHPGQVTVHHSPRDNCPHSQLQIFELTEKHWVTEIYCLQAQTLYFLTVRWQCQPLYHLLSLNWFILLFVCIMWYTYSGVLSFFGLCDGIETKQCIHYQH